MLSKKKRGADWQETSHGWAKQKVSLAYVCVSRRAQASKELIKTSTWVQALDTHCCKWPAGKAKAEVQMFVEANSKPHDIVIYTGDSVT